MTVDEVEVENARRALDRYVTYQETIERTGIKRDIAHQAVFKVYQDEHNPPLGDLFEEWIDSSSVQGKRSDHVLWR